MNAQSEIIVPSGAPVSKELEATMREEDDFMIRHGWYMSSFYEAWRDGGGRAVEKKRGAERAKYIKLYKSSTIYPDFTSF